MSARIEIVPAMPRHVGHVATRLRDADRREIAALTDDAPEAAVRDTVATSFDVWCGLADGEPVSLFGLSTPSIVSGRGIAWHVGTDGIERHAIAFLRRNHAFVEGCHALCPVLFNMVQADHAVSIRWLSWLGYRIADPVPFGPKGALFRYCERTAA